MYYLVGAVLGLLCLLPFLKSSQRALAQNGYLALAMMLMIYIGAHLVSSDTQRIIYETVFAVIVLAVATLVRKSWPLGIGIMVLGHGAYDHIFGAQSGVADWYPAMCAGFDVIVGLGLIILIFKQTKQSKLDI